MKKVKRDIPKTCEACRALEDFKRGRNAANCKWLNRDKQCIDLDQCNALITASNAAIAANIEAMLEKNPDLKQAMETMAALPAYLGKSPYLR